MSRKKSNDMGKETLEFLKNNWNWILLFLILIVGTNLRLYHVNYPVIGYHNWKEVHYLTEARNYAEEGFFKNGFFTPSWDYPGINQDPSGIHSDTFPTTSIIMGVGFKIFGTKLVVARVINVLMIIFSIILAYLIIKKLFKSEELALTIALLMSLNPLLVFFARQVQLINASMLFGLIGIYFYLKWLDDFSWKNTVIFAISISISVMTKYSFALFLIPMIFLFPYKKIKEKKYWKKFMAIILIAAVFLLWIPYSTSDNNSNIQSQITAISINKIFEKSFWNIMKAYAADNYTLTGIVFACIGLILFLLNYNNKKKELGYKFFMFYLLGSVAWFLVMSFKLSGHNYHQYPIAPLIVFFIAYLFVVVGNTIGSIASSSVKNKILLKKIITIVIIGIMVLIIYNPSIEAKDRMYNTQFFGLDIAGEYIKNHKVESDRIIHSSHQAYGLLWHGDIKGTSGIPKEVERFKYAEDKLNTTWLFVYNWDFQRISSNKELWDHISKNYRLVQTAFTVNQNQLTGLYYFLFRKGGNTSTDLFTESGLNVQRFSEIANSRPVQSWQYERTYDKPVVQYINLE